MVARAASLVTARSELTVKTVALGLTGAQTVSIAARSPTTQPAMTVGRERSGPLARTERTAWTAGPGFAWKHYRRCTRRILPCRLRGPRQCLQAPWTTSPAR